MIRAFEGGHVATTEAALGEYVKALALVDRLDNTALLQTLSVRPLGTHLPSAKFTAQWCRFLIDEYVMSTCSYDAANADGPLYVVSTYLTIE